LRCFVEEQIARVENSKDQDCVPQKWLALYSITNTTNLNTSSSSPVCVREGVRKRVERRLIAVPGS
jgi:hypothetical protein